MNIELVNQLLKKILPVVVLLGLAGTAAGQVVLPDFTVLVEKNAPAIVKVSTTRAKEGLALENQAELDELLRLFNGGRAPELNDPESRANLEELLRYLYGDGGAEREERGATGSGFIIDTNGYIVTNHHVVAGADGITVTLYDQRELDAQVVGTDELSDLALLKVKGENLPIVTLGESSNLKVGEWVLAMGSPFGLQYSVAAGIISYMGRALPTGGVNYVSYIQTDVAINPGHSGGPLFNLAGEVIGINSQIFTNSGGSIGLSFAIPVDVARNVVGQLRDSGAVSRGWVGVSYDAVSQDLAEAFNLDAPHGALVNRVVKDSPAAAAGIEVGDIVVAFDGKQIRTGPDLPYYVGLLLPGQAVNVEIVRAGESRTLQLTVGSIPTTLLSEAPPAVEEDQLGLVVSRLDAETRQKLGIDHGVLVEEVDGAAEEAGILPGDIVITLNNVEIDTPEALAALAEMLPVDRVLPVLVARGAGQSFFTIKLGD